MSILVGLAIFVLAVASFRQIPRMRIKEVIFWSVVPSLIVISFVITVEGRAGVNIDQIYEDAFAISGAAVGTIAAWWDRLRLKS